jgi:nitrate reductase alpha subunit
MASKYQDAHVLVVAPDGSGTVKRSDLYHSYREAKDEAIGYARQHPDEVVMICKPISMVDNKMEIIEVGHSEKPPEEREKEPEPA